MAAHLLLWQWRVPYTAKGHCEAEPSRVRTLGHVYIVYCISLCLPICLSICWAHASHVLPHRGHFLPPSTQVGPEALESSKTLCRKEWGRGVVVTRCRREVLGPVPPTHLLATRKAMGRDSLRIAAATWIHLELHSQSFRRGCKLLVLNWYHSSGH